MNVLDAFYNRGQWRELVEGDVREESRTGLSRLLMQVLGEEEDDDVRKINVVARKRQIELREDVGLMEEAFSALCNGLVELSSMPKYQQEEEVEEDILRRVTDEEDGLPMWLLGLLVCCKLEEGDEAGIRIQVKFHIFFFKSSHDVALSALSNPHFTGTGCAFTICDGNPDQGEGGPRQQQQSGGHNATSHFTKAPGNDPCNQHCWQSGQEFMGGPHNLSIYNITIVNL